MNSKSENVLKALSSSTRRTIMRQISVKGSATYTEIMHVLNLDPTLMSGKFNYHLKELNETGLIERTNGEYKITDLGKRALILVDQVAEEVKIDRYGVLSAVMAMSPKKELELFLSQLGLMVGIMTTLLGIIPFVMSYGTLDIVMWLSGLSSFVGFAVFIVSVVKMVRIVRTYRLGFSSIVFLSSNWFFIRSPNRNNFFVSTLLAVGAAIGIALSFLLPYSGEVQLFTNEWFGLVISSIGSLLLSTFFLIRAKKKANQLEETTDE
jgi:predicted transcriptional regulator